MTLLLAAMLATLAAPAAATQPQPPPKAYFTPAETRATGSVDVGGRRIAYQAIAGTLVVHSKGWQDTDAIEAEVGGVKDDKDDAKPNAEASMYYTAYFRNGAPAARPITFLFNGGPGS